MYLSNQVISLSFNTGTIFIMPSNIYGYVKYKNLLVIETDRVERSVNIHPASWVTDFRGGFFMF